MHNILIVIFVGLSIVRGSLVSFSLESVLSMIDSTCVVLVINSASDQLKNAVVSLWNTALINSSLPVGLASHAELFENKFVHLKLSNKESPGIWTVIVLNRKIPDRTCLLKSNLKHVLLTGTALSGIPRKDEILDLINRGCQTFWTPGGQLSAKGLHRNDLLQNLFTVDKLEHYVSMGELTKKCGINLKEYFYTGQCFEEKFCEKEMQKCVAASNKKKGENSVIPQCETVNNIPSRNEFFEKFLSKSKPVVLKNAIKNWPAFNGWSNEFFRKKFAHQNFHIKLTPPVGQYEGVESISLWNQSLNIPTEVIDQLKFPDLVMVRPHGMEMTMTEFLDLVEKKSNKSANVSAYLEYTPISSYMKGLENDLSELPFMQNLLDLELLNVWLSDGNTLGKLHMDQYDNLLCQVRGRKQLILFDPSDNERLYEGHLVESMLRYDNGQFYRDQILQSTAMTMSPVDITQPDFQKFPNFGSAIPLNCTIEAGDVLYLPAFWWHEVQSYPDSKERRNLAVNFWYTPFFEKEFPCPECSLDVNPHYYHLL